MTIEQEIQTAARGLSLRTKAEIGAALVFLAIIWYEATPKPAPVGQWQPAKVADPVKGVQKEIVAAPKGIVVYAKQAKAQLNLPPAIQTDQNKQVIAADQVHADLHPQTVATIFDASTGQTETIVRRDPYPWLAAEQTGEIWVGYGVSKGQRLGMVSVSEDLLQVKALHFGVNASLMTDGSAFVGAGVGYKW